MDAIFKEFLSQIKEKWFHVSSLIILLLLVLLASITIVTNIRFEDLSSIHAGLIVFALVVAFFFWFSSTRIPKAEKGTIGISISIIAESKEHQAKITSDMVTSFENILKSRAFHHKYSFPKVPEYYMRRLNPENVDRYIRRSRCHFLIYGKAREREIDGAMKHVFNLDGIVRHVPLTKLASQNLSQEFTEVLPRGLMLPKENDLLALEFTAEWVAYVAQYVIGIASFCSGDLDYSQFLFEDLKKQKTPFKSSIPGIQKISTRLATRLSEVYGAQASLRYRRWRLGFQDKNLEEMKTYLDLLSSVSPENYSGILLRAIWHFLSKRDVKAAISEVRQCKKLQIEDSAWRFSYAFLLAYRGDLHNSLQQYKIISRLPIQKVVPIDVEEFLLWVLEKEPEKVELHFCLGCVNFLVKEDDIRALEEFEQFLRNTKEAEKLKRYREPIRYARSAVARLRSRLRAEQLPE